MTDEERLRKQVKVLESEMYYKEKEMLRVYRELDRFRRKCELLRLRLRRSQPTLDCGVQTDREMLVTSHSPPVESAPSPATPTPAVQPTEAPSVPAMPKQRARRSAISRMLNGAEPFNKTVAKDTPDEPESPKAIAPPAKRKAAYMQPYAPPQFQSSYIPAHLQPASNTPLYESLQRKEGPTVKWRESFQMLKMMYLSKECFGPGDVEALTAELRGQLSAPVATFLVQELSEAADVLHFSDALEMALCASRDLLGRDRQWDTSFLKCLRALATDSTEQRRFRGCQRKMPQSQSLPADGSVLTLIVYWHTNLCVVHKLASCYRDFVIQLLCRGNTTAAKIGFGMWGVECGVYSMKVVAALLDDRREGLMQELTLRASVATISDEDDIYKSLKVAYCMSTPEAAYQLYSSHLWNVFTSSFSDSPCRRLILKSIGALVQIEQKANKHKTAQKLQMCLEDILNDTSHAAFTESEQRAAAHSLRKCKNQSPALSQWLAAHS